MGQGGGSSRRSTGPDDSRARRGEAALRGGLSRYFGIEGWRPALDLAPNARRERGGFGPPAASQRRFARGHVERFVSQRGWRNVDEGFERGDAAGYALAAALGQ